MGKVTNLEKNRYKSVFLHVFFEIIKKTALFGLSFKGGNSE